MPLACWAARPTRYTAFYALYPVGVLAEMWIIWSGLPAIGARRLHSISLPNRWNWAFSYQYFMLVSLPPRLLLRLSNV